MPIASRKTVALGAAGLCVCMGALLWWESAPVRKASLPLDVTPISLVQISGSEELTGDDLRDFCDNELSEVSQLLELAPTMDGEALLWTMNQMDARLSNAAYFS